MADRLGLPGLLSLVVVAVLAAGCAASDSSSPMVVGREVYASTCAVCHGNAGQGAVGPALTGVASTWPDCTDQIRWIMLGSDRWRAEVGDTYGATAKPVLGGMLPQEGLLTPTQIAAVATFVLVTYGGIVEATAIADCGLTDQAT